MPHALSTLRRFCIPRLRPVRPAPHKIHKIVFVVFTTDIDFVDIIVELNIYQFSMPAVTGAWQVGVNMAWVFLLTLSSAERDKQLKVQSAFSIVQAHALKTWKAEQSVSITQRKTFNFLHCMHEGKKNFEPSCACQSSARYCVPNLHACMLLAKENSHSGMQRSRSFDCPHFARHSNLFFYEINIRYYNVQTSRKMK